MSDKKQIIKNAYISYGFLGESRLFTLLSKDHKEITKEDIKNFLGHQEAEQIYKPHINPRRSKQGSITANTVNELWQMDIFSLFNLLIALGSQYINMLFVALMYLLGKHMSYL